MAVDEALRSAVNRRRSLVATPPSNATINAYESPVDEDESARRVRAAGKAILAEVSASEAAATQLAAHTARTMGCGAIDPQSMTSALQAAQAMVSAARAREASAANA